jgi:hypothetical protein
MVLNHIFSVVKQVFACSDVICLYISRLTARLKGDEE